MKRRAKFNATHELLEDARAIGHIPNLFDVVEITRHRDKTFTAECIIESEYLPEELEGKQVRLNISKEIKPLPKNTIFVGLDHKQHRKGVLMEFTITFSEVT